MLLSTPLSLLLTFSSLHGTDDLTVERHFNAVIIQNGMKVEVEGSGPEAFVVALDGTRIPKERARWHDGVLEILNEEGDVAMSLPLSTVGMGALEVAKDLPPAKMQGFLGIQMNPVDVLPPKGTEGGTWDIEPSRCTMIVSVVPNSPAAAAGLASGDIIIPQTNRSADPRTLSQTVAAMKPGTIVSAIIIRNGEKKKVEIELGARPADAPPPQRMLKPSEAEVQLQNLMEDLHRQVQHRMQRFEREQLAPFLQEAQLQMEEAHSNLSRMQWEKDMNQLMSQFEAEVERRFKQLEQDFRPWAAEMGEHLEQRLQHWGEGIGRWSEEMRNEGKSRSPKEEL